MLQTTWEDFQREGMELSSEDKVRLGLLLQIAKRNDWEESYPAMLLHLKNRTAVEETSTAVSQQRPLVNRLGTPDRSTNASISIRSPIGRKMSSGDESPLAGNWIGSPPDTQGCVHDEKNRPGVRLLQFTSTPTGFHGEENLSVDSLDVPVFADMRRVKTTRSDCGTFGHDSPPMSPLRFGSMPRFSGPTSCSSVYSPKRLSRASWSHDIESSMSTPAASVHLSAAESEFQVDMDSLERSIRVSSWASSREDDCRAPVHWDIESPRASISSHSSSSRPEGEIPVLETTSTPRSSSHSETCTPARQPALGESIFGNALTRALQGVSRRLWSESRDALPVINATPPASSINSYQSPGGADTPLIGSSLTFSGFPVPQISASTESPRVSRRRKPPALPASQSHGPHDGQADQSTRHDGKCASDLDVAEADAVQHEGWERPGPGEMDKAGDVDTAKLTLLRSLCGPEDNKASQYNTSDSVKNAPPVLAAHPPSYRKPSTMVGRRNSRRHGAGGSTKETVMDVSGLIVVREAGAIPPRPDSADEIEPKACKMDAFAALEAYYSETQGSIPGPNQPAATRQPIGCASLKEGQDVVVENLEGLEQHPAVVQKDDSLARRVPIHDRQIESKAADPRQFSSDGSAENPNDTAVPQSFRRPYRGSLEDSAEEDMEEVFFMADVDTTIAQGLPRKIQTSASVLRAW